jgi:hypothetical protein
MDRLDYVERYSMFGAFRSTASNVGPNAAFLSAGGQLTDMGAWYLGRGSTGVSPSSTVSNSAHRAVIPIEAVLTASLVVALGAWLTL